MNEQQTNPYVIPISIVVSGVLIAGSIMYAGDSGSSSGTTAQVGAAIDNTTAPPTEAGSTDAVSPVTRDDHILGNPSAPVKIVEFSDLECPFCARFHQSMQQLMDEFGNDGQVAWVYRHFPLESIHPSARMAATGAECANELAGAATFWNFVDTVFLRQENGLSKAMLIQVAADTGLNGDAFSACLQEEKYNGRIDAHAENAVASGGRGTPYSIIIAADGSTSPVNGAVPYATLKAQVEAALAR